MSAAGVVHTHPVACQEIWHHDDRRLMQTLVGMTALCPACHEVKHIGVAGVRGRREQAKAHLAHVNWWTTAATDADVTSAFELWRRRSQHQRDLGLSMLAGYAIAPPDHDGVWSGVDGPAAATTDRVIGPTGSRSSDNSSGASDIVFWDAPKVTLYAGWQYVMVQAGARASQLLASKRRLEQLEEH